MQEQGRVLQNLGFGSIDKQQGNRTGTGHQYHEGKGPIDHHHQRTRLHPLPDTFRLTRTVILSRIRSHGYAETFKRAHKEHLDAHGSRKSSHTGRAQRIVGTLQHDTANGRYRELKSHRHPDIHQPTGQRSIVLTFGRRRTKNIKLLHHIEVAKDSRNSLRHQRGNGRTGYSPPQDEDAEKVEHNVQHRRKQQEPERGLTVAQGTDDTDKGEQQIAVCSLEDIVRRTHPVQDIAAQQTGNYGYHNRHHRCQLQTDEHITAHRRIVARTELLGDGNAEATTTSVAKTQNKKDDRRAGTHRCQRINAQKASDNGRIYQRISLLEQIA